MHIYGCMKGKKIMYQQKSQVSTREKAYPLNSVRVELMQGHGRKKWNATNYDKNTRTNSSKCITDMY